MGKCVQSSSIDDIRGYFEATFFRFQKGIIVWLCFCDEVSSEFCLEWAGMGIPAWEKKFLIKILDWIKCFCKIIRSI